MKISATNVFLDEQIPKTNDLMNGLIIWKPKPTAVAVCTSQILINALGLVSSGLKATVIKFTSEATLVSLPEMNNKDSGGYHRYSS